MPALIYKRVLLKLSGEALMGRGDYGIDPAVLGRLADEIVALVGSGIQIGIVIGGGNIFRGASLAAVGIDRVTGDHMGMLATVMNALAMQDALEYRQCAAKVMAAFQIGHICADYDRRQAIADLVAGTVVLFAAGTGNPFFTTDSAASLRAIEIGAEVLIKATKVNGVYSADPLKDATAIFYPTLSYEQALRENLQVMDTTAILLCRDYNMPLRVLNIHAVGALTSLLRGEAIGSLVHK